MTESQYYVRSRARVRGPFNREELSTKYARGEVGRMHEISEDGHHWKRATEYPDLFGPPVHEQTSVDAPPREEDNDKPKQQNGAVEGGQHAAANGMAGQSLRPTWYYAIAGEQKGPVELSLLQLLVNTAQIGPNDLVWKEGMIDWVTVKSVPMLQTRADADDQDRRVSAMAIASFVLGVFGLVMATIGFLSGPAGLVLGGICGLIAVVFGPVATGAVRVSHGRLTGSRLAVTGLVLGILTVCLAACSWLAVSGFDWLPWIEIRRALRSS